MMKRKTIITLLVTTIGFTQPAPVMATGIPVIDIASITQQIMQVMHLLNQLKQMKKQLQTANKELDSISGSRGLGNVINSIYDPDVNVDPNDILNNAGIKSAQDHGLKGDVASLYDSRNENTATWLGQSEKSLKQSQDRFDELINLVAEVNNTPDQKDVLDLQARISAEEVMLQNEMAKLTMLKSQAEANEAMNNQRIQQMSVESSGELRQVNW